MKSGILQYHVILIYARMMLHIVRVPQMILEVKRDVKENIVPAIGSLVTVKVN